MTSLPSCVKLLQECQKDLPLTNLFFSLRLIPLKAESTI